MSAHEHEHDHGGCSERHDDLAAYALGALPPGESAALEQHLAACDSCRERLLWLRPAADLVPASVPQLNARPELKRELMAIVREEAPAPARGAATFEEPAKPGPFARFRRKLLGDGPLRPALAGFAAFCLVVVGIAGYELGTGDDGGSGSAESFAALPTSPKTDAHGTVEVEGGNATLTVADMDSIPHNEVYQAWIAEGDTIQPSSVFVVDSSGGGSASIPDLPNGADRVMITREPAGGSTEPSTAPVLSAEL